MTLDIHVLKERVVLIFEPAIIFSSLVILYIAITYLDMTPSSVLLFMVITVKLVPIIRSILMQKQSINRTKGSIEAIDSLVSSMRLKNENFSSECNSDVDMHSAPNIKLQNVSYRYVNTSKYALSNVSLTFDHGTINGVIGPSGSGKTYMISVLCDAAGIPFAKKSLARLSSEGYKGENLSGIVEALKDARKGILFFDEFDKVAVAQNSHWGDSFPKKLQENAKKIYPLWKSSPSFKEFMIESYKKLGIEKTWVSY